MYRLDLGFVNASLVDDGDVTLVDAGMGRTVDRLRAELDDGAENGGFTAIHTPGHTPGHAV